ncbi:MAG: type I restriction-modification system subunit M N-terminal domain-containing protein [Paracoccaceae bacterium]
MVDGDVEKRLWSAADQLWANTGLKPSQFSTPVLGLIFLRFAEKRFAAAGKPDWSRRLGQSIYAAA